MENFYQREMVVTSDRIFLTWVFVRNSKIKLTIEKIDGCIETNISIDLGSFRRSDTANLDKNDFNHFAQTIDKISKHVYSLDKYLLKNKISVSISSASKILLQVR